MDRSVAAIGATSGSISALILRLVSELSSASPGHPFECPVCPEVSLQDLATQVRWGDLDLFSCLVGVGLGLLLGPLLDVVHLIRHSWQHWIKVRLRHLGRDREEPLYKRA